MLLEKRIEAVRVVENPQCEREVNQKMNNDPVHSFLLQPVNWVISGIYRDEKSVPISVRGQCAISHHEALWLNEMTMELMPENREKYRNLEYKTIYEYKPLESGMDSSSWVASNPSLGKLHGFIVIADDAILSLYQSSNGNLRGSETLIKISDRQYQCRGALLESGVVSSSWILQYDRA